jgi:hypothetical protein
MMISKVAVTGIPPVGIRKINANLARNDLETDPDISDH